MGLEKKVWVAVFFECGGGVPERFELKGSAAVD